MAFTINKTKAALNAKSKAHKKLMSQKVSLVAMAVSDPGDILGDLKLERRAIKSLKGLKGVCAKQRQVSSNGSLKAS